jgi:hypothetical protein
MFDQRHVSKSLSPFHKATKEWRFSCDCVERYISAVARKFKQCGAKDLDLTEVWAYRQIKKGWKNSRPPPLLKAARRPVTIDILAAMLPDSTCRMNSTRWRGCPSRHRKTAFYASANSCALRSKRFVSTEHVQLILNYCV